MTYSVQRVTIDKLARVLEELGDQEPDGVTIRQIDFVGGRDYVVIAQGDVLLRPARDGAGDTPARVKADLGTPLRRDSDPAPTSRRRAFLRRPAEVYAGTEVLDVEDSPHLLRAIHAVDVNHAVELGVDAVGDRWGSAFLLELLPPPETGPDVPRDRVVYRLALPDQSLRSLGTIASPVRPDEKAWSGAWRPHPDLGFSSPDA